LVFVCSFDRMFISFMTLDMLNCEFRKFAANPRGCYEFKIAYF